MKPPFLILTAAPGRIKQPERSSSATPVTHNGPGEFSHVLARETAQGGANANAVAAQRRTENADHATTTQQAGTDADAHRAKPNSGSAASANGNAEATGAGQQAASEADDAEAGSAKRGGAADRKIGALKQTRKGGEQDDNTDNDKEDTDGIPALHAPSAADLILALASQIGKLNPPQSAAITSASGVSADFDTATMDIAASAPNLAADSARIPLRANGGPLPASGSATGNGAASAAKAGGEANADVVVGVAGEAKAVGAEAGAAQGYSTNTFQVALASHGGKTGADGNASVEPLRTAGGPTAPPVLTSAVNVATAAPASGPIATASNMMPDKLAPAVGSNGWDRALGQRVVWMVGGAEQSASLSLNPPDLGPLQVVLNVSQGQATADFTAAQPEVRQALEAAMPRLREMLSDVGINLGQANVSAGNPQQHGRFAGHEASPGRARNSRPDGDSRIGGIEGAPAPGGRPVRAAHEGIVDTFA
jgi:flagellar hook-length control protein FliK